MDKAMEYIDKLAAKLGVAAEHVYGVLVKQAFATGVTDSIIGFVFLMIAVIAGVIITKMTIKMYGERHCNWDYEWFFVALTFGLSVVLPGGFGIYAITEGIKGLINPEYYAIKEILDTIGGK
ncbi:hypothetical protein ACH95_00840 [Bacillus glycinifermentans]|uniref:Uncharacterized protein n=1 Tax=Bacillus glycinifermentans TaxID=1664069 RepID=A0A0J6F354_9BACI|nr:hypothetical protein [Bacillus glycinifermentans]ATH93343.1 hypothetical protein COP00_12585 [Bacillus glycinifermentans]ATH95328.1 hypothetical protein COP00_24350 [Bacillus glycinifermentans]KMM63409.1 hypothetical protein ACH95_00840 [Bacillus glycinifermentans]KRT90836.1 hypothetical protein AB447_223995 [Bacillus glycinifermentans]MEC0487862.1 hypothetical protein [Bacillus glycinifermentans]